MEFNYSCAACEIVVPNCLNSVRTAVFRPSRAMLASSPMAAVGGDITGQKPPRTGEQNAPTQLLYKVMRWLMNLVVSVGLMAAGLYVLYEELFVRYSGIHGRYQPFAVGLVLLGSGVVWLWFYVVGDIVLKRLSGGE